MNKFKWKNERSLLVVAFVFCAVFFVAYSTLSIVRHNHYQSFGYDLGINDQVVWRYSRFQPPLTTSDPYPTKTKLVTHIELPYAIISPFYWIWSSPVTLLLLQAFFVSSSGLAIYLLAKRKELHPLICLVLVISYLAFYGVQNALLFDVHSSSFACAIIAWFIYFLDSKKTRLSILFLFLAITAKENIGLLTLLISTVYFIKRRDELTAIFITLSFLYVLFIYLIYFPIIISHQYLYQNTNGLLSNLNPVSLFDSHDKRETLLYSLGSFGFIPLLLPLFLLPALGHFSTFFILASDLTASHGIFMHYRITLTPLLAWATIMTISRITWLNNKYVAIYLLICTLLVQYMLHLPLSYLSKQWFWTKPSSVENITYLQKKLSVNDSVVAQNNILPHISQRDMIFALYPSKQKFLSNSPCGQPECNWFQWSGDPMYLFVDTSSDWDIRHLFAERETFIDGIKNLEKAGVIEKYLMKGNASLYKVIGDP